MTYPVREGRHSGQPVVFVNEFLTERPRQLRAGQSHSAAEKSPTASTTVFFIGRQLEYWQTGPTTRRASVLDPIEPEPVGLRVSPRPRAAGRYCRVKGDRRIAPGHDFALRAGRRWHAARRRVRPVLLLRGGGEQVTNPRARSVRQGTPSSVDCAVRVVKGGPPPVHLSFGGGTAPDRGLVVASLDPIGRRLSPVVARRDSSDAIDPRLQTTSPMNATVEDRAETGQIQAAARMTVTRAIARLRKGARPAGARGVRRPAGAAPATIRPVEGFHPVETASGLPHYSQTPRDAVLVRGPVVACDESGGLQRYLC